MIELSPVSFKVIVSFSFKVNYCLPHGLMVN